MPKTTTASATAAVFGSWFGIPPMQANLLWALWRGCGRRIPPDELANAIGTRRTALAYHVCMARQAMDVEAIDSPGRDPVRHRHEPSFYELTEVGQLELTRVLEAAIAELAGELKAANDN